MTKMVRVGRMIRESNVNDFSASIVCNVGEVACIDIVLENNRFFVFLDLSLAF